MTKTKMISLDDEVWALASKKKNFSEWVSECLKKENEGKKIISQAYEKVADELGKQKSEKETRLRNAQDTWDRCKKEEPQLARMVYQRVHAKMGGKVIIFVNAPALEYCIGEFRRMQAHLTPSPDPTPKEAEE